MFCREKLNIYSVYCHIGRRKRCPHVRPSTLLTDCWWMNLRPRSSRFCSNSNLMRLWSRRRRRRGRRRQCHRCKRDAGRWWNAIFPSNAEAPRDFIAKLALLANACVIFLLLCACDWALCKIVWCLWIFLFDYMPILMSLALSRRFILTTFCARKVVDCDSLGCHVSTPAARKTHQMLWIEYLMSKFRLNT